MGRWGKTLAWACAVALASLAPLACSDDSPKRPEESSNQPGWHEVRFLKRAGVIDDFRPVRPQKPVEYPTEYEINDGAALVRFARPRSADGPDLEIEGASDEFADRIVAALKRRGLATAPH
jgi:hypothetical protein